MKFEKLLLWGGLGYLGYKMFKGGTYAPGDAPAANLHAAAVATLDPTMTWTINVEKNTGAVSIEGVGGAAGMIAKTFPNSAAALAWVQSGKPHGQTAAVTYNLV